MGDYAALSTGLLNAYGVLLILGALLASGLIGRIAGRNRTGFWYGFCLGPIGWVLATASGARHERAIVDSSQDDQHRHRHRMKRAEQRGWTPKKKKTDEDR
jgi:hypothetical protein